MRLMRLGALFLVAALLGGCSAIRFAYNNADAAVHWVASDYLVLDGVRGEEFNARLASFHDWHRAEELPRYAALLSSLGEKLGDGITREEILWAWESGMARVRAMAEHGAPQLAIVVADPTPAQLAQMQKKFIDANAAFRKKYLKGGEADQRERRFKRNLEMMEDWFGDVSYAQEAKLRELSDKLPLLYELRLADRERRQREFLALLREHSDPAELALKLGPWLGDWETGRSEEFRRVAQLHQEQYIRMLLELDRGMTSTQRQHAVNRLREYSAQLAEIAQESRLARSAP
jgi:Family of unknown function (DUF6279)